MLEANGKPDIGQGDNKLSARPGTGPRTDIPVDADNQVRPGDGGLSVNGCACTIPPTIAPQRLVGIIPGAKRPNTDNRRLWSHGASAFVEGQVSDNLHLRPNGAADLEGRQKGYVEPRRQMGFDEYQQAIASMRDEWNLDEQRNRACPICGQPE